MMFLIKRRIFASLLRTHTSVCRPVVGPSGYPLFDRGIEYVGYDVSNVTTSVETFEDCLTACDREPDCYFWTFDGASGDCRLKYSDMGYRLAEGGEDVVVSGKGMYPEYEMSSI